MGLTSFSLPSVPGRPLSTSPTNPPHPIQLHQHPVPHASPACPLSPACSQLSALASYPSHPSITLSPSSSVIMLMMLGPQLLTPRNACFTLSMPSPQRGEPPSTPPAAQLQITIQVPLCDLDILLSSSSPRGSQSPGCPLFSPFQTWTSKSFASVPLLGNEAWMSFWYTCLENPCPGFTLLISTPTAPEPRTQSSISSVQFSCSVVSNSLQLHELQHARPP